MIETGHKPLLPLLDVKHLDDLPPRIRRLARFIYTVEHSPGKSLNTANALSRVPVSFPQERDQSYGQETEQWLCAVVESLPASKERLKEYVQAHSSDDVCSSLKRFCQQGWPAKNSLNPDLKFYWESRHKLTLDSSHGLLLYGTTIVVPCSLQSETLEKLHLGH